MFGWKGALTAEQTAQIAAAKQVIYDGFQQAIADGVPKEKGGILVDEQFGAAILRDARKRASRPSRVRRRRAGRKSSTLNMARISPRTSRPFIPTFCKVLVRYNPEGDPVLNSARRRG
jgi:myo-inositol catabolism protein IolC